MKQLLFLPLLLLLTPLGSDAGEKQRDWQTGKVLDSERNSYFAGTIGNTSNTGTAQANGNSGTYQGNTVTSQTATIGFTKPSSSKVTLTHTSAKNGFDGDGDGPNANLTVNGPVKFAVEKTQAVRD